MDLERLSITLRPRNGWEAADLGIRLAVREARSIYPAWLLFITALCVLLFGGAFLLDIEMFWAFLLLWWLRPLSDRVILHRVSHLIFGETPSLRDTLRALPGMLWRSALIGDLLWRRIDLRRSLRMPVAVLEGLRGKPARQRRALIARRVSGTGIWLTLGLSWLETVICFGSLALLFLLLPESLRNDLNFRSLMVGEWRWLDIVISAFYIAAHVFIEPLYVAAGFMLYIKRRNDLEAWDIELQFRRLQQAHEARASGPVSTGISAAIGGLLLCAALACSGGLNEAHAAPIVTDAAREARIAEAPEAASQVMADPVFGTEETRREWKWKPFEFKNPDINSPNWLKEWGKSFARFVSAFAEFLATAGRGLGWAVLAIIIVALIIVLAREMRRRQGKARSFTPLAELAGFDIRPESLPDDVAAAARQLMQTGKPREALSLLFRGALSALAWRDHVPFAPGDTEGDCLDRVHQHAPACFSPLARLLSSWQTLAWAHRDLDAGTLEQLCREWPQHFSRHKAARGAA
ncbi:DUF4129 domain-containing protein [Viridibacterium curvum]|uniref:DUF4129 domain-containing protein n=1 Tax=Viridibacterium curvum TaxID=1101404 RepID=A0ABP9QJR2_9RHOO